MTVTEFAVQTIFSLVVAIGGSGAITWLARTWISERLKASIKAEYDQQLESHKAKLKAEADVELEKLRSRLALEAKEHDVVFSKLHEKRGEVIADLYAKLKRVQRDLAEFTKMLEPNGAPSKEERFNTLVESERAFFASLDPNLIFLPEEIATALIKLHSLIVVSGKEFKRFALNDIKMEHTDKWIEIDNRSRTIIPTALANLEKEFRSLLGYKTSS